MSESSEIEHKPFFIFNNKQRKINGDIYLPQFSSLQRKIPAVFILHGFKGYKDWGFFPYISQKFAENEFISIRFNFSLNGRVENKDVLNVEDFANNTISQQIEDLKKIIEAFQNDKLIENNKINEIWNGDIYLLGHSLGAGISLLASNEINSIKKIVLWASIAYFNRYSERQQEIWKNTGVFEFFDNILQLTLKLNYSYIQDIEQNNYSLESIIKNIQMPIFQLHGSQDVSVKMKEAEKLIEWASDNKYFKYEIIERCGHTFGIKHPFTKTSDIL